MNCTNCRAKLAKDWSYCPYCGKEVVREHGLFEGIERLLKGLFAGQHGLQFNPLKNSRFTIKIKSGDKEQVISNIKPKSQVKILTKPRLLKMPNKLIEPEASVKRVGSELEITIELPGVKSLNDISISQMGESIEVRAVSHDKGYFKILSVPNNYQIINKSISNEVLLMRLMAK